MAGRIRVAVVFGGRSSEHTISCVSAGSVLAALDRERYEVVPVGVARDGRWVLPGASQRYAIEAGRLPEVTDGTAVVLPADPTSAGLVVVEPGEGTPLLAAVDVVFPLLHGPYGEDGTLQGLLEMAGVPYVGSGVFASAAAMDKQHMKSLLRAAGLPVVPCAVVRERDDALAAAERLGWPVFVKPARGGSSIGISKVRGPDGLAAAIVAAAEHDPKLLIEAAVVGREVECGVLGGLAGAPPEASLPAEIRVTGGQEFYDFEAKYLDDSTSFDLPADLPEAVTARLRAAAVEAFRALDCEGLARVDFFVCADDTLVVNEVNTMPGFTPASMFPRMWQATGVSYPELVDRLVTLALDRGSGLR